MVASSLLTLVCCCSLTVSINKNVVKRETWNITLLSFVGGRSGCQKVLSSSLLLDEWTEIIEENKNSFKIFSP